MTDAPLLTAAFLERLPESAAQVIGGMPPTDAAALFETIPVRIVSPVVEKMEKWPAALCLQHLSIPQAASILGQVSYQDAMVLLRLLPLERRDVLFEQLPSRLANDLKESLRYPRNCVGAWMDLSVPTLSLNATIKDAVIIVRSAQRPMGEAIFVVDEGQHLAGVLWAEALVRYSADSRLVDIIETGLGPLFSRMLLREAASVPAWRSFLHLPVVGRRGQLIGVLSRNDMMKGLTTIGASAGPSGRETSIWGQVGEAFMTSVGGLANLLGGVDSDVKTSGGHSNGR